MLFLGCPFRGWKKDFVDETRKTDGNEENGAGDAMEPILSKQRRKKALMYFFIHILFCFSYHSVIIM